MKFHIWKFHYEVSNLPGLAAAGRIKNNNIIYNIFIFYSSRTGSAYMLKTDKFIY